MNTPPSANREGEMTPLELALYNAVKALHLGYPAMRMHPQGKCALCALLKSVKKQWRRKCLRG